MVAWAQIFLTETTWSPPTRGFLEHELLIGVDGPVMAFTWTSQGLGQFDETLVEAEIVTNRILPTLVRSPEKGKSLLEIVIDLTKGHSLDGDRLDGHHDHGNITERWFFLSSRTMISLSIFPINFRIC